MRIHYYGIALGLLLVLLPVPVWAWGVGVHIQLGSYVLSQLNALPPQLAALLAAHSQDYLYGCIAADITIGKKYTHFLQHCHSWLMGFKVQEKAQTPQQQACAYGYLSHLAADTIAHGYLVPYQTVRTYRTALLKHAYWELRFEAHVPGHIWQKGRQLAQYDFYANDQLLRSVLADTLFSFSTNKHIFNSLLLLNRFNQWRRMLRRLSLNSKWNLGHRQRQEYLNLAKEATMSLLTDIDNSPYLRADPTGERALDTAKEIRRNLHLLWLEGKLSRSQGDHLVASLQPEFRDAITDPDRLLHLRGLGPQASLALPESLSRS